MHLDHVSFAVGAAGLAGTTAELGQLLGATFLDGGAHPRFGTRNMILPLKNRQYLEVVEVLDHPASDKAAFGQAVRERSDAGGGWMAWCVSVDDMEEVERRIGRHAVPGNRRRPDGFNLQWRQIGTSSMRADPQLPYVTAWDIDPSEHPSQMADSDVEPVGESLRRPGDVARRTRGRRPRADRRQLDRAPRTAGHHGRDVPHPGRRRPHLTVTKLGAPPG
jgi:hypothetical protein